MVRARIFVVAGVLAWAGCGGGGSGADGGQDPGMDLARDLAWDLAADSPVDAAQDVPRDTAEDSGSPEVLPDVEDLIPSDDGAREDEGGIDLPGDPGDPGDPGIEDLPFDPGADLCDGPWCAPCPDDGLACTDTFRDEDGRCFQMILPGWCVVRDNCFEAGQVDPSNTCLTCQPDLDPEAFSPAPGLPCDDGVPCSTGGVCTAEGTCVPAAVPCDDHNVCTVDRCEDGVCRHLVPGVPSTCDDGNRCTLNDRCSQGVCVGTPKTCPQGSDPCTANQCDPADGLCKPVWTDVPCEDGDVCTTDDACVQGRCVGTPRDCSDGNPCTHDYCVPAGIGLWTCDHRSFQGACEDGDLCTVGETCGADGLCRGGEARICNDYNPCTSDSCDPAVGCVFTPLSIACDDGDPCTVDDFCREGSCRGTPRSCDDGNPCTEDFCRFGGCWNVSLDNGTPCDDGDVCTTGDQCQWASCRGTGFLSCDDGNACTQDACVPRVGCSHLPVNCDDGNPCTTDLCDNATGCRHLFNANACDDRDACTVNDQCIGGTCVGAPRSCSDGDPCTIDTCQAGQCLHQPNYGPCEDGDLCTAGETCQQGRCVGGQPITCNDLEACTADSCNPSTGCVFTPISGSCNDYSVCTVNDRCQNGRCVGTPISCDDGNACTDDLCDPLSGCYHQNNTLLCNDGNLCTVMDQCKAGVCAGTNLFRNPVSKTATLAFTTLAKAGQGLDLDNNPATCQPQGDCQDGVENLFAKMGIFITDQFAPNLATAVAEGRLGLLLEHETPGPASGPYDLNLLFGRRVDPTSCNPAGPNCNYRVLAAEVLSPCTPRFTMNNASINGNVLTAGGSDFKARIYFVVGTTLVPVDLWAARVQATVTVQNGVVTGGTGVLAGGVNVRALIQALESVPASQFSPYTKDQVIQQIDSRLCASVNECGDMNTDGRPGNDSASIGLPFTLVTGNVVGRD